MFLEVLNFQLNKDSAVVVAKRTTNLWRFTQGRRDPKPERVSFPNDEKKLENSPNEEKKMDNQQQHQNNKF